MLSESPGYTFMSLAASWRYLSLKCLAISLGVASVSVKSYDKNFFQPMQNLLSIFIDENYNIPVDLTWCIRANLKGKSFK
jgi:hypothetical protein